MAQDYFFDDEFKAGVVAAGDRARRETLAAGISVFYRDDELDVHVMEEPSGRKFEICYIANAPGHQNYKIIREIHQTAA